MKTLRLILLSFALMASSCTQYIYTKPGCAGPEFKQDLAEAEYHAEAATINGFNSYSSPFLDSNQRLGESIANGVQRGAARSKLIHMYLRMKGWTLTKMPAKSQNNSFHSKGSTQYLKTPNEEGPNEEVDEG